jgi:hypothetical protein
VHAYGRLWARLPGLVLLSTIIHFSEFNDAACVLASPLLRTPPLSGRTSVRLPTRWLAFGRVGLESASHPLGNVDMFQEVSPLFSHPEFSSARAPSGYEFWLSSLLRARKDASVRLRTSAHAADDSTSRLASLSSQRRNVRTVAMQSKIEAPSVRSCASAWSRLFPAAKVRRRVAEWSMTGLLITSR